MGLSNVLQGARIVRPTGRIRKDAPPQTMAATPAQSGATRPPVSLLSRFIGIITAPRATYESVVAHPKWFGMLALVSVLMALLVGGFLLTKVGQEAWLDAATATGPVSGQQDQGMEKMGPFVGYMH